MCGILGAFSGRKPFKGLPFTATDLDRMTHRGPDGQGWFVDDNAVMAFRRLAIIDLAGGAQPLFNEDESIVLTINGEIYNYHALRKNLSHKHRFRARVDGEALLHLYEDRGLSFLDEVNGMFAFALYDRRRRRIVLGRDRSGKKPLYYEWRSGQLKWASEIKVLLRGHVPPINRHALWDYLRFGYVPAPLTMLQGINKLPASTLLVAEADGEPHTRCYWRIKYRRDDRVIPRRGEMARWACDLRHELDRSVGMRLESEVPMGLLLSGGIDSSSVFASAALAMKDKPRAFTISFADEPIDESKAAAEVATRYGAKHYILGLKKEKAPALAEIMHAIEEPVSTDALLPTNEVLSGIADARITTVLTGEGSDELFAGYRKFRHAAPWNPASKSTYRSPLQRYLSHEEYVFTGASEREALVGNRYDDSRFDELEGEADGLDPLSQMLFLEATLRLPDRINLRLDRLSMLYSIEARAPFMDFNFMQFCANIPNCLKTAPQTDKWILRHAMRNRLPDSILKARKAPFHSPDSWHTSSADVERVMGRKAVHEAGLVCPDEVRRIRALARLPNARHYQERLFSLYVLHSWYWSFYRAL